MSRRRSSYLYRPKLYSFQMLGSNSEKFHFPIESGFTHIEFSRKVSDCGAGFDSCSDALFEGGISEDSCSLEHSGLGFLMLGGVTGSHRNVSPCSLAFFHSNIRSWCSGYCFQCLIQSWEPGSREWKSSATGATS